MSDMAASVDSDVGAKPAVWSWKARAMVKQPAWAAAINSSGLVPFSFWNRVAVAAGATPFGASLADHVDRLGCE
jgi:hypothetical protein